MNTGGGPEPLNVKREACCLAVFIFLLCSEHRLLAGLDSFSHPGSPMACFSHKPGPTRVQFLFVTRQGSALVERNAAGSQSPILVQPSPGFRRSSSLEPHILQEPVLGGARGGASLGGCLVWAVCWGWVADVPRFGA